MSVGTWDLSGFQTDCIQASRCQRPDQTAKTPVAPKGDFQGGCSQYYDFQKIVLSTPDPLFSAAHKVSANHFPRIGLTFVSRLVLLDGNLQPAFAGRQIFKLDVAKCHLGGVGVNLPGDDSFILDPRKGIIYCGFAIQFDGNVFTNALDVIIVEVLLLHLRQHCCGCRFYRRTWLAGDELGGQGPPVLEPPIFVAWGPLTVNLSSIEDFTSPKFNPLFALAPPSRRT